MIPEQRITPVLAHDINTMRDSRFVNLLSQTLQFPTKQSLLDDKPSFNPLWNETDRKRYMTIGQNMDQLLHQETVNASEIKQFETGKEYFYRSLLHYYGDPLMDILFRYGPLGEPTITGNDDTRIRTEKYEGGRKENPTLRIIAEHTAVVMSHAYIMADAMKTQLVQEKAKRNHIDLAQINDRDRVLFEQQAIDEVVMGAALQDVTKSEEIRFNNPKKFGVLEERMTDYKLELLANVVDNIAALSHNIPDDLFELITQAEEILRKGTVDISDNLLYEKLSHIHVKLVLKNLYKTKFSRFGDLNTILDCAEWAGMPVASRINEGEEIPHLAAQIANVADKLVQHTGSVNDLSVREAYAVKTYGRNDEFLKRMVRLEYKIARNSLSEFAMYMGYDEGEEVLQYIKETHVATFMNMGESVK